MLKNKKMGRIILLAVFIVAICMQSFWWFVLDVYVDLRNTDNMEELQNIENRKMASKPMFSVLTYTNYPSDYENYFNDNYPFRSKMISIDSIINYFLFNKSTNEHVIVGVDDWLFYRDTLADYERNNLYSEEELRLILDGVLATKQYFDETDTEFVIFIAPNKNTIYGEYMPKGVLSNKGMSRTEQAVEYIRNNPDVTILFPEKELIEAKENNPDLYLYFKLDSHWNRMGGYWGANVLLKELKVPTVSFEKIHWEEVNEPLYKWNGFDLANMLGLTGYLNQDFNYRMEDYSDNIVTYDGNMHENLDDFNGAVRSYSDAEDKRKLCFCRDSFGEGMVPYLAAAFEEMYCINMYALTKTSIE